MEEIIGYKAYNKGLINQFNEHFEVGKEYTIPKETKWQNSGFHFSKNMEDVLRYYNGFDDIDICVVMGYGNIRSCYDSYYDYETYLADNIKIIRVLTRQEIIDYARQLPEDRLCRFITGYKLTDDEREYFYLNSSDKVKRFIRYYQLGEKDAFSRR